MKSYSIYYAGSYQSTHRNGSKRGLETIASYPALKYVSIFDEKGNEIPRSVWETWSEEIYCHA